MKWLKEWWLMVVVVIEKLIRLVGCGGLNASHGGGCGGGGVSSKLSELMMLRWFNKQKKTLKNPILLFCKIFRLSLNGNKTAYKSRRK